MVVQIRYATIAFPLTPILDFFFGIESSNDEKINREELLKLRLNRCVRLIWVKPQSIQSIQNIYSKSFSVSD